MFKRTKIKKMNEVCLTRDAIRVLLKHGYERSDYAQKREGKSAEERNKMSYELHDFGFIFAYKSLLESIENNYKYLISDNKWKMSTRQEYLIQNRISYLIQEIEKGKFVENAENAFWEINDYFDDYGNKEQIICKEEFEKIIPYIEKFTSIYDGKMLSEIIEILKDKKDAYEVVPSERISENEFKMGYVSYNLRIFDLLKIVGQDYDYSNNFEKIKEKPVENMTKDEVKTYVTFIFRKDRFCEGFFSRYIDNDILRKLIERYLDLC